jgi:hypothetical protein
MAQSTRSTQATQIRELTQDEQQSTSTRVVANYNHAHALTMQYYEVLQIYKVATEAVQAQRCVFIPMKPVDFSSDKTFDNPKPHFIELLRQVLRELGAFELEEMVANIKNDSAQQTEAIKNAKELETEIVKDIADIDKRLSDAKAALEQAAIRLEEANRALIAANASTNVTAILEAQEKLIRATAAPIGLRNEVRAANDDSNRRRPKLNADLEKARETLKQKQTAQTESGRLSGLLARHSLLLNQRMWMLIDDYSWYRLLADRVYPDAPYEGQALGNLVSPTPVGYFGNYVAFAWDFEREAAADAKEFEKRFTHDSRTVTESALPAEGLFAEAVLGQSNSAEKIDITRFWNWQDSPIPILPPSMAPVDSSSRARDVSAPAPLSFEPALAKLRDAGVPPDISDAALLQALQTSLIGDNAALIQAAQAGGTSALEQASAGAGRAGQRVLEGMKNVQDFAVGLANSEAAQLVTTAVTSGATGGLSSVGGLINAADQLATKEPALTQEEIEKLDAMSGAGRQEDV